MVAVLVAVIDKTVSSSKGIYQFKRERNAKNRFVFKSLSQLAGSKEKLICENVTAMSV